MSEVRVEFVTQTAEAWRAMLGDIARATQSIDFEQYIFSPDNIGQQFIELLLQKKKAGVKVRLIADMAGSYALYNSFYPEFLRQAGIEVRFFNPIRPWRITNFTSNLFRDHRKILVVDNNVAHLGGVCIDNDMELWRDTDMRITGPIVAVIAQNFEEIWQGIKKGFYIKYKQPAAPISGYNLLINAPSIRQRYIYHNLISAIHSAKKYIYLTTPYFIPDIPFFRALRLAVKRGVEVRIIVPKIADHLFINHARESYFTLALRAGMKIYVYTPSMMHTKTAVVDDRWATAGSFNLDNLSFYFNHEANIASTDSDFVNEMKNQFFRDLESCHEIRYDEWIKRPLRKKFLELLTWPFHGVL